MFRQQFKNNDSNQFRNQIWLTFIILHYYSIRQIYYHYLQPYPLPNLMSTGYPHHLQRAAFNQNMNLFKDNRNYKEMKKGVESDQSQILQNQLSFGNIQGNHRGSEFVSHELIYSDIYQDDNEEDSLFGNQCQFLGSHQAAQLHDEQKNKFKSLFEDKDEIQIVKNEKHHQNNSAWEMNADHILKILRENDQKNKQLNEKRISSLSHKSSVTGNEGNNQKALIMKSKVISGKEKQFTSEKSMNKKIKIQNSKKQEGKNEKLLIKNQKNKICKTQYESGTLNPIKFFQQLQLQRQSLQCTFKPTSSILLNAQIIKNKPTQNANKNKQIPLKTNTSSTAKNINANQRIKTLGDEYENRGFKQPVLSKILSDYISSDFDVIARNKLWQQQKESKLYKLRKEEEQKKCKKQNYSHSPMIIQYKAQCEPKISKFRKQGTVQHIQRLSMAKRKTSVMSFKQEQTVIGKQQTKCVQKQNISHLVNKQKCTVSYQGKRRTYEQAVKQLHNKINKMKI